MARIGRGYQMDVIVFDPFLSQQVAEQHHVEKVELEELLPRADVITIHCPLNDTTRGLIGAGEIEKMKPTVILVNCARGGIVEPFAQVDRLRPGGQGAACIVFGILGHGSMCCVLRISE